MKELILGVILATIGVLLCLGALEEFPMKPLKNPDDIQIPWLTLKVPAYVTIKVASFMEDKFGIIGLIIGGIIGIILGLLLTVFSVSPWVTDVFCIVVWCLRALFG